MQADASSPAITLTGFHQMAVDSAGGHIFLSEGLSASDLFAKGPDAATAIVVTDLSGNYVTTLDAGDGVEGIALSADGGTLYAALAATRSVGVISTSSLTQTATYSLGLSTATPYSVAVQSGKLWVSYSPTGSSAGGGLGAIGDFDLSAAAPAFETQSAMGSWYAGADLAADPSDSGVLVAADATGMPTTAATYDVAADPATVVKRVPSLVDCGIEHGVAMFPGGAAFVLCGQSFSTTDLSTQATYRNASSQVPAISPDGGIVALGEPGVVAGSWQTHAYAYQADGTAVNDFLLGDFGGAGAGPAGLAFGANGSLYGLAGDSASTSFALHVYGQSALTQPALNLSAATSGGLHNVVTVSGILALSNAGTTVTITRSMSGSSATPTVFHVTTAAGGVFSLVDTVTSAGTYTYQASSPGYTAGTESVTVTVNRTGDLFHLNAPSLPRVTPGESFTLTGLLEFGGGANWTSQAGLKIAISRTKAGTATAHFTATTDANGDYSFTDNIKAPGTYLYTASYPGSPLTAPATATRSLSVQLPWPALSVRASASKIGYQGRVTVTAHLGASGTNRTLSIYAKTNGTGPLRLLRRGTVDSHGNLAVTVAGLTHNTTLSASFSGDASYAAHTASISLGVGVRIGAKFSGYFETKTVDGYPAYVFHHTSDLAAAIMVTPNKHGQCIKLEVQQFQVSPPAWFANATYGCDNLNSSSQLAESLGLTQATGALYRVRVDYLPSNGDTSNSATDGAWFYFDVVT
jgi:hypothetical protein